MSAPTPVTPRPDASEADARADAGDASAFKICCDPEHVLAVAIHQALEGDSTLLLKLDAELRENRARLGARRSAAPESGREGDQHDRGYRLGKIAGAAIARIQARDGALVPHGIGGLARRFFEEVLRTPSAEEEQVARLKRERDFFDAEARGWCENAHNWAARADTAERALATARERIAEYRQAAELAAEQTAGTLDLWDAAQKRIATACDLLAERIYGHPARSPGHNARLILEALLHPEPRHD